MYVRVRVSFTAESKAPAHVRGGVESSEVGAAADARLAAWQVAAMVSVSNAECAAVVASYLRENNYMRTLEAFESESPYLADNLQSEVRGPRGKARLRRLIVRSRGVPCADCGAPPPRFARPARACPRALSRA